MMTVFVRKDEVNFLDGWYMQFTKAEAYGLFGLLYLADQPAGKITPLSEISEIQDVQEKFLAKIFQSLSKSGIIRSHRGVKGGFTLARPATEITFREVVEIIHGPYFLAKCFNVEDICDRKNCSVKILLEKAQDALMKVFEEHTIANMLDWQKETKGAKSSHSNWQKPGDGLTYAFGIRNGFGTEAETEYWNGDKIRHLDKEDGERM